MRMSYVRGEALRETTITLEQNRASKTNWEEYRMDQERYRPRERYIYRINLRNFCSEVLAIFLVTLSRGRKKKPERKRKQD